MAQKAKTNGKANGHHAHSHKTRVEATINGENVEFLCEPRQSMLEVLRDVLELTGSKEGCLTGDCGACSVMVSTRLAPAVVSRSATNLPAIEIRGASFLSERAYE